ncbi:MAG: hypothetical protein ABIH66_11065 [bacterium]
MADKKKIAVVGAEAVGSVLGGFPVDGGQDVTRLLASTGWEAVQSG